MPSDSKLYSFLAFAGAMPFMASALLPIMGIDAIEPFGRLDALASSYALAIISFLAGIHWATHLYNEPQTPANLFVISNVVLLFVWFTYVLATIKWQLLSQFLALWFLVFVDFQLRRRDLISNQYFGVRLMATTLAGLSLLVIILRI